MCYAPITAPLLWQAERVPGDSDSSRQTETARRTSATAPTTIAPTTASGICGDSDSCLSAKWPGYVCATEARYCTSHAATMGKCCPITCNICPPGTLTAAPTPSVAPTTAPTAAPTTPALLARTALSTACSVHVSSTNGTDSDTCGESTDSACKSIQHGIERAGDYNTICVHKGIFGCETGWAGS